MTTYVALLRGINVGGRNLIRMPALKACFEDNGFEDVSTYIQSGNVLFATAEKGSKALTERIEAMLADAFDYVPTVVVRSRKQMRAIVEGAPKGSAASPEVPIRRHLPEGTALGEEGDGGGADEPGGRHRSRGRRRPVLLEADREGHGEPAEQDRRIAHLPGVTIRNWNTTTKLLSLME